jgi:lysophospholipase L1-like esterase
MTRIVAFGSSNTERYGDTLNWFDWVDILLRQKYGRVCHIINSGICGETTRELCVRFDRDVKLYQPHLVFITIGGNDSSVGREMGDDEYRTRLSELADRVHALPGCRLVFQTYYACDLENMEPGHPEKFVRFMQIIREVAADKNAFLVDHLARWERLRKSDAEHYRGLMDNAMHVNPLGNMLLGLDVARHLGATPKEHLAKTCAGGVALQKLLDSLEG